MLSHWPIHLSKRRLPHPAFFLPESTAKKNPLQAFNAADVRVRRIIRKTN